MILYEEISISHRKSGFLHNAQPVKMFVFTYTQNYTQKKAVVTNLHCQSECIRELSLFLSEPLCVAACGPGVNACRRKGSIYSGAQV